ncbi:hypothetical protein PAHAL_1G374400 [Panicum hallii]|uniref:Uncharacterized protein n=1 Tax=Panicum hallii TaxID=206008 RepID=A0A2T8KXI1_9POAL|nr:uncharacterized protein LOC112889013 [Panicum hallii]PVH66881.1 hypothetical protein PAHAL_1G374400 [Panicum hallii]
MFWGGGAAPEQPESRARAAAADLCSARPVPPSDPRELPSTSVILRVRLLLTARATHGPSSSGDAARAEGGAARHRQDPRGPAPQGGGDLQDLCPSSGDTGAAHRAGIWRRPRSEREMTLKQPGMNMKRGLERPYVKLPSDEGGQAGRGGRAAAAGARHGLSCQDWIAGADDDADAVGS